MNQLARIQYPHVCQMSLTLQTWKLPSGSSGDNHSELAVHPRMNFRSEQCALHCVRSPLTLHTSCHASVCYDCLHLLCLFPLYSSVDPEAAVDYTTAGYDYVA